MIRQVAPQVRLSTLFRGRVLSANFAIDNVYSTGGLSYFEAYHRDQCFNSGLLFGETRCAIYYRSSQCVLGDGTVLINYMLWRYIFVYVLDGRFVFGAMEFVLPLDLGNAETVALVPLLYSH